MILALIAALVADICLMPTFRFGYAQPVLLYLFILYSAFKWDAEKTVWLSFIIGVLRDFSGAHSVGIEMLSLLSCSLVLIYFIPKMDRDSWIVRLSIAFLYLFASQLMILMCSGMLLKAVEFSRDTWGSAFRTSLLSAALFPLVFWLMQKWFGDRMPIRQYELFSR